MWLTYPSFVSSTKAPYFGGETWEVIVEGKCSPGLEWYSRIDPFLKDTACYILDAFNYISRLTDGLKFTIRDLELTLKALEKDLACRKAKLVCMGDAYVDFGRYI